MTVRKRLEALVRRHVRKLIKRDTRRAFQALESTMELTGYIENTTSVEGTCREVGRVIIALAGVISIDWLRDLAHGAVFYEASARGVSVKKADAIADEALRKAGVNMKRYLAELESIDDLRPLAE